MDVVCLALADPKTGGGRKTTKSDLIGEVMPLEKAVAIPTRSGGAILVDLSFVIRKVLPIIKAKRTAGGGVTVGEWVDEVIEYVERKRESWVDSDKRDCVCEIYILPDNHGMTDAAQKASRKRWEWESRQASAFKYRTWTSLEHNTVLDGNIENFLKVSQNKHLFASLVYERIMERVQDGHVSTEQTTWVWCAPPPDGGSKNAVKHQLTHEVKRVQSRAEEADFRVGPALDQAIKTWRSRASDGVGTRRNAHRTLPLNERVFLLANDTDIVTFLLSQYGPDIQACECPDILWQRDGTRFTSFKDTADFLTTLPGGEILVRAVWPLHLLSGCDYTSALFGYGKKSFWQNLLRFAEREDTAPILERGLLKIAMGSQCWQSWTTTADEQYQNVQSYLVQADVLDNIELFMASLYMAPSQFSQQIVLPRLKSIRTRGRRELGEAERMPICVDEMEQHVLRCLGVAESFLQERINPGVVPEDTCIGRGFYKDSQDRLCFRWCVHKTIAELVKTELKDCQRGVILDEENDDNVEMEISNQ